MFILIRTAALFAALGIAALASTIAGVVLDPKNLPILGASVAVKCGTETFATSADASGRFAVALEKPPASCQISIHHPGFKRFEDRISQTSNISVHLEIESLRSSIEVNPETDDLLDPRIDRMFGGASLERRDLESLSDNTADFIRYTKLFAGVTNGSDLIHVNGMPSAVLPPARSVERITVNDDPFSAEFADSDNVYIDILTRPAKRKFRFDLPSYSSSSGAKNPLNEDLRSHTRTLRLGLSGPIPELPATFSLQSRFGVSEIQTPLFVDAPGEYPSSADSLNRSGSVSLFTDIFAGDRLRGHVSYLETRNTGTNSGTGGFTLPEAGLSSRAMSRDANTSVTAFTSAFTIRTGLSLSTTATTSLANSEAPGIIVPGALVGGGATMTSSDLRRNRWSGKGSIQSNGSRRTWVAGVLMVMSDNHTRQQANQLGMVQFENLQDYANALRGAHTGTRFLTRGNGVLQLRNTSISSFVQGTIHRTERLLLAGGLRNDYQQLGGFVLSPRISLAAAMGKTIFRAGAAVFTQNSPDEILTRTALNDSSHLQRFIVRDAGLGSFDESKLSVPDSIDSRISPDFRRPQEYHSRVSVERRIGAVVPGLEYSWTRGRHLVGLRRLPGQGSRWLDLFESNRSSEKHRLHTQARFRKGSVMASAHYEWLHLRDNTDGLLSYPEDQQSLSGEWARSTGVAPHNVTFFTSFRLPKDVTISLVESFRSSSPYNITTGLDVAGNSLFNDRGGRERNSGSAPASNLLGFTGRRRFSFRILPGSRKLIAVNLGLQGENILGARNVVSLGSVTTSPMFGKAIAASTGRSFRVWMNFD